MSETHRLRRAADNDSSASRWVLRAYVAAAPGLALFALSWAAIRGCSSLECIPMALGAMAGSVVAALATIVVGYRLGLGKAWGVLTVLGIALVVVAMLQVRVTLPGPSWMLPFWIWVVAIGLTPAAAALATLPPLRTWRFVAAVVAIAVVSSGLVWADQTVQDRARVASMVAKLEESGLTPIRVADGRDWDYHVGPTPVLEDRSTQVRYVEYRLTESATSARSLHIEVIHHADRNRYLDERRAWSRDLGDPPFEPLREVRVGDVVASIVDADGFSGRELDEIADAIEPTTVAWLANRAPDPNPWQPWA